MRNKAFYAILLIFLSSNLLLAQISSSFSFSNYTLKDGLPHNATSKTIKDAKGFLWIGTDFGVSRYDGFTFRNYKQKGSDPNSIKGNFRYSFEIDGKNRLWVSCLGGMAYYDEKNDNFKNIVIKDTKDSSANITNDVRDMFYDKTRQCIWFTSREDLFQLDINTLQATQMQLPNKTDLNILYLDSDATLWISSQFSGCYRYNIKDKSYKFFDTKQLYNDIFEDKHKNIWFSLQYNGISKLDKKTEQFIPSEVLISNPNFSTKFDCSNIITVPSVTGENILWIATKANGIYLYDPEKRRIIDNINSEDGLPENQLDNIYLDKNILWISTYKGLTKMIVQTEDVQALNFSFLKHFTLGISKIIHDREDKNLYWFSTMGDGLYCYDNSQKEVKKHFEIGTEKEKVKFNNWVFDLYKDDNNSLWIACDYGLMELKNNRIQRKFTFFCHKNFRYSIFGILPDKKNPDQLILNVGKHIAVFSKKTGKYTSIYFDDIDVDGALDWIRNIKQDDNGYVWAASTYGLKKIDINTQKIETYQQAAKLKTGLNDLCDLCFDNKGIIWAVGGHGIIKFDPNTKAFTNFEEENGLDKNSAKYVFMDKNNRIWMYSIAGLFAYDEQNNYFDKFATPTSMSFTMQHQTQNAISFIEDEVYITLFNNYFKFNPTLIGREKAPKSPIITDFFVFDKRLAIQIDSARATPFQLNHNQNTLTFSLSALNFTSNDPIQYRYRLLGLSDNWNYIKGANTINYSNLSPNSYMLELQTVGDTGIPSEKSTFFNFDITPPYWTTWWFRLLLFSAIIGIIVAIFRYRELERIRMEKVRLNIARDLHDEMGSELSSISILSQLAAHQSMTNAEKAKETMQSVGEKTRAVFSTMRDIVWSINPENDNFDKITIRLRENAFQNIANNNMALEFNVDEKIDNYALSLSERKDFFLLYKEAISNIIRHSKAKKVSINLNVTDKKAVLSIQDDGIGFDTNASYSGNGLKNMQNRAKNLQGTLNISSEQGKNTTLKLVFPINHKRKLNK